MNNKISVNTAVILTESALGCTLSKVANKEILFEGVLKNGESIGFCSPWSKYHSPGRFWVDITLEQYKVMERFIHGIFFFRLEGECMLLVGWPELKKYLINDALKYNENEGYHWKLHIYRDYVEVLGWRENVCYWLVGRNLKSI